MPSRANGTPEGSTVVTEVGVVVIGRNEGKRLGQCLASIQTQGIHQGAQGSDAGAPAACDVSALAASFIAARVVYVDSGSTDDSIDIAVSRGVSVVRLGAERPFTAARGRMAGVQWLREQHPHIEFVQFIDGDCVLEPGWLEAAVGYMQGSPNTGVVCGRLKELRPEKSIFNRLCDMEWDVPGGEVRACGGIAMMRMAVLVRTGGFRSDLIAGEEPELCVRIRAAGWKIIRLPRLMAHHDANMTRLGQWSKRAMRGGFASAQGMALHGSAPERHGVAQTRSALLWGIVLPAIIVLAIFIVGPVAGALFLLYPIQILRIALADGRGFSNGLLRGTFLVYAKFLEAIGVCRFVVDRIRGDSTRIIEYK